MNSKYYVLQTQDAFDTRTQTIRRKKRLPSSRCKANQRHDGENHKVNLRRHENLGV
jgi:hypothetical protein